jgi:hypothetical protein
MGASLSWFAFRDKTKESVLQDFGLKSAGNADQDTRFSGGPLPGGWYLVVQERHEFTDAEARRLSRGCEMVACFVEEHVMVSRAAGWKDGRELWSVTHNSEEDLRHLEVRGGPPAGFTAIRDRLTREQQEEKNTGIDFIFNIPVELAQEIAGYCHDEESEVVFENLVQPTFLQRVFGR